MADDKPITVQSTPNLSGKANVALDVSDFEAIVGAKGVKVWHDHSIKCPCSSKEGVSPQSTCKNCGGCGWLYVNRTETRMVVQSMNVDTKLKEWSEERLGIAKITARPIDRLTFMDRITLLDSESQHSEVIFLKEQPGVSTLLYGTLRYDPIEIYSVFLYVSDSVVHTLLVEGTDYAVVRNQIRLLQINIGDIPTPTISVRYKHRAEYTVLDLPRDIMVSPTKAKCTKKDLETQFPISAVARRSHYMTDRNDFENDNLLDNSFTGDPVSDFACLPATYQNSDGTFTQIITSGSTFTSADIIVTINGVAQPASVTNVNLSFTVVGDPVTVDFNNTATGVDAVSGTNLGIDVLNSALGSIGTLGTNTALSKVVNVADGNIQINTVAVGTVVAEGTTSIPVVDDVNFLATGSWNSTDNRWEVTAAQATVIGYNRARPQFQISYNDFDEGWRYINTWDSYVIPANAVMAEVDKDDYYKLVNVNAFGIIYRFSNDFGDYYNSDDDTYRLLDGTLSDRATVFQDNDYAIDHYSGLGWFLLRGGAQTIPMALDTAFNSTNYIYSDWILPMRREFEQIFNHTLVQQIQISGNNKVFDIQLNLKSSTPYANNPTTQGWQITTVAQALIRNYGTADAGSLNRIHYT